MELLQRLHDAVAKRMMEALPSGTTRFPPRVPT
jgi:hypothetical protein